MSSFLLAVATLSLYTGPKPEPVETFRDWITGCDNTRACTALALAPAKGDLLAMVITQPVDSSADPLIAITAPIGVAAREGSLFIDGARIAMPPVVDGGWRIGGPQARALLAKLRGASMAELRADADGAVLARASLAGLTAALLRMDAQQGTAGTTRGLSRPGTRPPPRDMPGYSVTLTRPPRSTRAPDTLSAAALEKLRAADTCTIDGDGPQPAPTYARLDDESTLMILPNRCAGGAHNHGATVMLVNGWGEVRAAAFDYDNGVTGDGPDNILLNAGWNDATRMLEGHILHRGMGDCGRVDRYIWDGARFRLASQAVMPECRGSAERIVVWKADVAER